MAIKAHWSIAVHPGDWLKIEIVEAHNISINTVAEKFGVSRQAISALLNGRSSLTADMAVRFENAFGVRAETLLRMQARYDLKLAREHGDRLAVERLVAA